MKVLVCISFAVFELNDTSMDFNEINILVTHSCSVDELFINVIRKCRSLGRNYVSKFTSRLGHHKHCLMWAKMFGKRDFPTGNFVWVSAPCLPIAMQSFPCPLELLCLPLLRHCFTLGISPFLILSNHLIAQDCTKQLSDLNSPQQADLGNHIPDPTCYH